KKTKEVRGMYETTYDRVSQELWKMCREYGDKQIYKWLLDVIKLRKGEHYTKELRREADEE
ncbi:hypothetical protein, partial [Caloramator proteoclasticus]